MLDRFSKIVENEFYDILKSTEFIYDAPHLLNPSRLRVKFKDGSILDIRYDEESGDYSVHWQKGDELIARFNNAPHHPMKTFPRHLHLGQTDEVVEDDITSPDLSPEDNFRRIMDWIRNRL